jgi:hypothetical protein
MKIICFPHVYYLSEVSRLVEKSEQVGLSLYLERETEANVSLYEHFGFTVIKKITLPMIDLPMWEMTRGG